MAAGEETYVKLARMSADNHKARRATQWKVFGALWGSLIALIFYLLHTGIVLPTGTRAPNGTGALFVLLVTVFLVVLPMQRAFRKDRLWQNYYAAMAEGKSPAQPSEPGFFYGFTRPAAWAQILITLFLLWLCMGFILNLDKERREGSADTVSAAGAPETTRAGE
jgi:hypothetical protein